MVDAGTDVDALIDEAVLAEYRKRGYWRSPRPLRQPDRNSRQRPRRSYFTQPG